MPSGLPVPHQVIRTADDEALAEALADLSTDSGALVLHVVPDGHGWVIIVKHLLSSAETLQHLESVPA